MASGRDRENQLSGNFSDMQRGLRNINGKGYCDIAKVMNREMLRESLGFPSLSGLFLPER